MKILFDHNVPRQLRCSLVGHEVRTTKEMGWTTLENGKLLDAAEGAGFGVFGTGDKRLSRQQRTEGRSFGVVVLGTTDRKQLEADTAAVLAAVERAMSGSVEVLPRPAPRPRLPRIAGPKS